MTGAMSGGPRRALRGGCWWFGARHARAAFRNAYDPSHRDDGMGLRLMRRRS